MTSKIMRVGDIIYQYYNSYDNRGNLVKETNDRDLDAVIKSYTYDATNKMVSGTNEKGEVSAYTYNGLGVLVNNTKTTADRMLSTDYVVDYTSGIQNNLMAQEAGGLDYRYVYGLNGRISANVKNTQTGESLKLYIQNDRLGSGRFASNESGEVVWFTDIDVWGNVLEKIMPSLGGKSVNVLNNYTNYDFDDMLEIYYTKARMYDPEDRRFLAADPVKGVVSDPQSMNLYAYVLNNPLKFIDLLGFVYTPTYVPIVDAFKLVDGSPMYA